METSVDLNRRKWTQCFVRLAFLLYVFTLCSGRKTLDLRRLADGNQKYHSVNLGGWLVIEGWIKLSLFDGIPNKDLLDGTQIRLKSVKLGTFVVAEDGGGQKVAVDRTNPSTWETFRIWRINDGT
eukprot:Gb_01371 [translate_table: standard]